MDLTAQTPAEIDTALSEIYGRIYDARTEQIRYIDHIKSIRSHLARIEAGQRSYGYGTQADIVTYQDKVAALADLLGALYQECRPYDDEFNRRGGWTRAWLVDNAGGHVHNTMSCNTCFPTTKFGWLPQVSGLDEDEIVALAGQDACTVCYPSAPAEVLNNPGRLELPARKAAREEREAAKAARQAAKIAKGITPDGEPLRIVTAEGVYPDDYYNPRWAGKPFSRTEEVKTLRTARTLLTDQYSWPFKPNQAIIDALVPAIAWKEDKTEEQVIAEAKARAEKRK
jgi:hypothetical protein